MASVHYEVHDAVGLITLDNPPVNAISMAIVTGLSSAIAQANAPEVRAVVMTGEPHFAAGADISTFNEAFETGTSHELGSALSAAIASFERLPKPSIAAVRGYALGGGLELAMGADFIYMAEDAKAGQPEIKLGIIPGAGGTQRLPRLVGVAKARDIIYTGRFVEASEALAAGLATKVTPPLELLDVAMRDAAALAVGPTTAVAAAKAAINNGLGLPLDDGLAVESEAFAATFDTYDAREGVAAFLEKREADFRGQ